MKEYAVNIRKNDSDDDWITSDMANWCQTWDEAFEAAEEAFSDSDVEEVRLTIYEDGEPEDFPLYFRLENGNINQYKNGELLCL